MSSESFLTNKQKDDYGAEFYRMQATFGRPIVIFKTAKETVVYTNPDHSFIFDQAPNNDIMQTTIQSGIFMARIKYGRKEDELPFNSIQRYNAADQPMIRLLDGEVRIKLDPTGSAFLKDADRVVFDGTVFQNITDKRPHGLFKPDFDTFFLKKLN